MSHPVEHRWYPISFAVAALVLLPLSVLLFSWSDIDTSIWAHLWQTQMPRLLGNTLTLVLGVGFGVTLLGVSLAWLTSLCEFPGRRWLDWALMLPFAIPAYVLAFVFIGLLDFAGPVQTLAREWFGSGVRFPRVRSTGGVIVVLVLVFYPYVYLLARSAFIAQGKGLMEAARVLGQSPWKAFWTVALPMARPAIGAGLALALMETLADFGAVAVFNYDTFTTAIYKTWYGFFSLTSATQLASLLLLAVMLVLYGERRARGAARPANDRARSAVLYRLRGFKALAASGWCVLVFLCAFVVPMLQLLVWLWQRGRFDLDERYTGLILHTLYLGLMAASITVAVALLLAYLIRFMAVAFGPLESALARIRPSLPQASRSLGVGGPALFFRIYLPLLLPGTLSAALLVFVDVLKEMPATLLMRPFGWDTLSVRIFEMTSEGEWARAALPALTLVLVGLLPVILLIRRSARRVG